MMHIKTCLSGLILFTAVVIFFLPPVGEMDHITMRTAAVAVFAFGFWSTGTLPEYLTTLLFFLVAVIGLAAPADIIFSGFQSTAFWLVFGGLVIGAAVKDTGLGERLAGSLIRMLSDSYLFAITIIVLAAACFAFLVPSTTGRVVLLVPIVVAVSDRLGLHKGRKGRHGLVMAATLTCYAPTCAILPANVANMILSGTAESIYGMTFNYGEYLLWHFPVVGLMKTVSIIFLARFIFPDQISSISEKPVLSAKRPNRHEKRILYIIAVTLVLWSTDFLHGISPAWVALASGIFCLLPYIGVLPVSAFENQINFGLLFYVAGILGIGSLVAHSGLGQVIGEKLMFLAGFKEGQTAQNFMRLIGIHIFLSPVTTVTGLPAIMTPLSQEIAAATGFPLKTVIMSQVIGYSTILLPYQVPPIVVGMQMGGVNMGNGIKITLALAAVSIIFLIPVNYFWWMFLGVFK